MFGKKNDTAEKVTYTWQQNVALYLRDLVYMLVVVMVLLMLFFRIIVVNGPSMENTLLNGDYMLLVSNLFYKDPRAGDVVVVSKQAYDNGKPIVKRVIATEGQTVDIDFQQGIVYVDGEPLSESYVNTPTNIEEGVAFPVEVREGCVFVMGDNRNDSKDSRSPEIGQVDCREILGKAFWIMFPGTDEGAVPRELGRIGVLK